jgi:hypothetical protein
MNFPIMPSGGIKKVLRSSNIFLLYHGPAPRR